MPKVIERVIQLILFASHGNFTWKKLKMRKKLVCLMITLLLSKYILNNTHSIFFTQTINFFLLLIFFFYFGLVNMNFGFWKLLVKNENNWNYYYSKMINLLRKQHLITFHSAFCHKIHTPNNWAIIFQCFICMEHF